MARASSSRPLRTSGVPVNELVAAGGLPERNKLLMQIYADVTGREIKVVGTDAGGRAGLGHARRRGGGRGRGRL